ncbi:metallo-beta-lactamase superfamily [Pyrenophora seminiperda CCB06]|uniref:Metallo-beta-lactamase superfamily n=1 Tax=Pyrenophora seminiperda CCB06 TaxID=1302712 RepID=A0A3M7M1L7_9PLEO|nr:metallo-beta-lactamase superfamily [Pyrenophora seminiperda CCB06]
MGRQVVFDLGGRKDLETYVPAIRQMIQDHVPGLRTSSDVVEILHQGGVSPESLEAVILSHSHPDHAGSPQTLPQSVKLVVGPGFKQHFVPGYPSNPSSVFNESDFEGREIIEIQFTENTKIGPIEAFDYFGDGSLQIMNLPGHAVGHIGALFRTTYDSFTFLAGDACHTPAVLRPSKGIPMPAVIPDTCIFDHHIERPCLSDE